MSRARLQKLFAALLALAVWQGAALLVHAPILLPRSFACKLVA